MTDIQDLKSAVLIHIRDTKTKQARSFTITGKFYAYFKKYAMLRPAGVNEKRFFLNYQQRKCTKQPVGVNKFGFVPREIAKYLQLQNPNLYTGHCFRRSSATILVDAGGDITTLKRHGGWKSTTVAESYIDESLTNKMEVANKILQSVHPPAEIVEDCSGAGSAEGCGRAESSSAQLKESCDKNGTHVEINHILHSVMSNETVTHPFIFNNCQNTININYIVNDKKNN